MSCLGPTYSPNPTRAWSRFQNTCPSTNNIESLELKKYDIHYDSTNIPTSVKYRMPEYRKGNILQYRANSARYTKNQIYALIARGKWVNRTTTWATQSDTYTNPNTKNLQRVNANYITTNETDSQITNPVYVNINCPLVPERKIYPSLPTNAGDSSDPSDPADNPIVPPQPDEDKKHDVILPKYIDPGIPQDEIIIEEGGELLCNVTVNPCTGEVTNGENKNDCYPTTDSDVPGPIGLLCWNNALKTFYPRTKRTYANSLDKWPIGYKLFPIGTTNASIQKPF
jgi:hypothetical protein